MDEIHQKILEEQWPTLMQNLELLSIIEHLTTTGILEQDDKQKIMEDPHMASEKLLNILCREGNKPNVFYEFLKALEEISQEKGQPCMICLLRKAEIQHWPPYHTLQQENNEAQEQGHKIRNRKKNNVLAENDHEIQKSNNNNDANYGNISVDGPGQNTMFIGHMYGDVYVQKLQRTVEQSRKTFTRLDKIIKPQIESLTKARTVVRDTLKEARKLFQEIKNIENIEKIEKSKKKRVRTKTSKKSKKAASPEDIEELERKFNSSMDVIKQGLSEMQACVAQAEQRIPKLKNSKALDNYRDKQLPKIANGRQAHNNGNEAVTKLPEIKTAQGRDVKKEETPNKRTFVYKNDFDTNGVIYYLGTILLPKDKGWKNPAKKEEDSKKSRTGITVKRSTGGTGKAEGLLEYFETEPCCTGNESNSWWGIDFGKKYTF